MSEPFLSPLWYRVAPLRARLRAHVRVNRHTYRDQVWYQLSDANSGRRHRLNQAAYRFVGRLDAGHTVGEIWDALAAEYGDAALSQTEVVRLLGQLNAAELIQCQLTPDIEAMFRQYRDRARRTRWSEMNPLVIRVRLFDPTRWLDRFEGWLPRLFGRGAAALWLAVVAPAVLLAAEHWQELRAFAGTHVDTPRYLLIAWLAYPVIKAVHELGHALAVRRWGGTVNDVGITLLVLMPVPYVDASAALDFPGRTQRAVVSAIGVMVELLIAAIALYAWLTVESGWVRDIAFVVMLIAGVSTVVFNGNPLLRFDGYHFLCDVLDLPNLDSRSRAWWRNAVGRCLLRLETSPLSLAAGELKWMVLYAPLAWGYRLYISVLIALWVAVKSVLLGLVAAVTAAFVFVVMPLAALARELDRTLHAGARRRALRFVTAVAVLIIAAALLVPVPSGVVTQAIVWLPENSLVRTETEGFVRSIQAQDGDFIETGQVLALLDDPALLASQAAAQSRLTALRVQQYTAMQGDRLRARNLTRAVEQSEAELTRLDTRVAQLQVRSQAAGRLVLARQEDLPGTFLKQGQLLGYILVPEETVVRAVVPHHEAALVRERARHARIWIEERGGERLRGELRREMPAAGFRLPSAALSDRNGGAFVTDPADTEHLRTLEPVVAVDIALPEGAAPRFGGRAWVRFDLGAEPLAFQWARNLGQVLLRYSVQPFGSGVTG